MNQELSMSPNLLVAALQKPASEFTKADIVSYIKENDIRMVNFMYPAADGRLKTLNFVINNEAYLDAILTCGQFRKRVYKSGPETRHYIQITATGLYKRKQAGTIYAFTTCK